MPVIGFNHYNLCAPQPLLDELRKFYVDVLGFELGYRPPFKSSGYWLYAGGKDILHLTETVPDEARSTTVKSTLDHIALTCSDLETCRQLLGHAGVKYTEGHVPVTDQIQLFFSDPAGNGIELNFLSKNSCSL